MINAARAARIMRSIRLPFCECITDRSRTDKHARTKHNVPNFVCVALTWSTYKQCENEAEW